MISSDIGLIHTLSGIIALVSGSAVLIIKKGTPTHKKIGYIYCLSMLALLITAFMIYRLFGGWGIFHWAALISTITLIVGMVPPLLFKNKRGWIRTHFTAMFWSVMGLYGAFLAEMTVRIPDTPFYNMVGLGVFTVMLIGAIVFAYYKNKWKKEF